MTATTWAISRWALWLLVCLSALGCARERPPNGIVGGKVTVAGQPATDAVILFEDVTSGQALWAELREDGSFVLGTHEAAGLPEGTYRVAVKPRLGAGTDPDATNPVPGTPQRTSPIPARYHNSRTSGLTATVQPGQNPPFNFDLPAQ